MRRGTNLAFCDVITSAAVRIHNHNCISKVVDLRTVSFDVPPQEVLTKDSVTVAVDAVVYYKVDSPIHQYIICTIYEYVHFVHFYVHTYISAGKQTGACRRYV